MKNIILVGLILCLVACLKDNETTTIDGHVINVGSKQPIDSVQVFLRFGSPYGSSFIGGSTGGNGHYVSTLTDKNGYFKISLTGEELNLYLSKAGYRFVVFSIDSGTSNGFKYYNSGQNYSNEVLQLWADCYFKAVFQGKNSIDSDSIYFGEGDFINYSKMMNPYGYGNGPFSPYGQGYKGIGDKYFKYWMKYQIKGIWHERIDAVFIKSFTTYTDTIYY